MERTFRAAANLLGSTGVSPVGDGVLAIANFLKTVSARRRNQHARRVRYPDKENPRCFIFGLCVNDNGE
jgi:hypothetical protein